MRGANDRRSGRRLPVAALVAVVVAALLASVVTSRRSADTVTFYYPPKGVLIAGQIGALLQQTNLLELCDVDGRFFTPSGLPTTDELVAEGVDVLLTGEADPLRRIAGGVEGKIVGTLGSGGSLGLVVPTDSPIRTVADLRGKSIGSLSGNALHRWLVETLNEAGLDEEDVDIRPFFGPESVHDERLDAVVLWDPMLRMMQREGRRTLATGDYHLSIFFGGELLADRPRARATLTAIKQAAGILSRNRLLAHKLWTRGTDKPPWFQTNQMSMQNHLYSARTFEQLTLAPSPEYVSDLERDVEFMLARGFIETPLALEGLIDRSLSVEVEATARPLEGHLVEVDELSRSPARRSRM